MKADLKRLLAWSTVSQMGLVVLSPAAGGALALTPGWPSTLFLTAGRIRSAEGMGATGAAAKRADTAVAGFTLNRRPARDGRLCRQKTRRERTPTCVGLQPHPDRHRQRRRLCPPLVTRAGAIQLPAPGIPPGTALLLISPVSAGLILTVIAPPHPTAQRPLTF